MKVAFFAYRTWAFDLLKQLGQKGDGWEIQGVYGPAVHEDSLGAKVKAIDPKNLAAIAGELEAAGVKVALFYGWSWLVPAEFLAKFKCVCLHPSMLPKYRGGSPIQNQIMRGENQGGVSLFFMTEGLDDGDVIAQAPISLEGELDEVTARIGAAGAKLSKVMLARFAKGDFSATPQDQSQVTEFKRRKPADSELKLDDLAKMTAREVHDFVRCLQDPYPNAFITCADGKKLFITRTKLEKE